MSASPITPGTRILLAGAGLLVAFLAVGAVLPGRWQAEARRTLAAPAAEILPHLDSPAAWREWTPWPERGVEAFGPVRGPGSGMRWKDPEFGEGAFRIVESSPREVRYHVEVEGSMVTEGRIRLEAAGGGTLVVWTEEGDFGWNPLMGYWALAMGRAQSNELQKGLERLQATVTPQAERDPDARIRPD